MEAKSALRIVTMAWYLNANLSAITRSTLINARWRMMLALREKLSIDLPMHNRRGDFSKTFSTTCKMKTDIIKRSTSAKLTKILFDAVRRFGNFRNAVMTIWLPKSVASARKVLIQTKKTFNSFGADLPLVVEFMIQKTGRLSKTGKAHFNLENNLFIRLNLGSRARFNLTGFATFVMLI